MKFRRVGLDIKYFSDSLQEIKRIESCLKFFVEGSEFSPAFKEHKWDGFYRFYQKKTRTFNYGLLHMVITNIQKYNIAYKIEDDLLPIKIKFPDKINPELWEHQKRAVLKFLSHPYGTIEIPTGGGKTILSAEIIRLTDFDTVLFIVDSQLLLEQAITGISEYLKVNRKTIGRIQGDTFEPKAITVAMIQTLQSIKFGMKRLNKRHKDKKPIPLIQLKQQRKEKRFNLKKLETYLKQVKFLIIDEIHEYSSDERINTIRICNNVEAVLCLSATPEKSENLIGNIKIKSLAGPIILKVLESELKKRGVLAQEDIILILIDHDKNKNIEFKEEDGYDTYENSLIIENERRNNILINTIQILKHLSIKTLVLFQYIKHGKNIQRVLGNDLITNETKLPQRLSSMKSFLKKKGDVLLATNVFNKGLNLPEVEVLLNAGAGKEQSLIIQKKGRTLRTTSIKKKAITIDIMDISEYFSEHSLSRIHVYEERIGVENIKIFDSLDPDFYDDIREYLNDWKGE
jgi:superfamily II DNA or RNA helicase